MDRRAMTPAPATRMRGLSLVEMMVALTLGLIVLAAVSTVFVNSRVNYTTQESLARLQENARFAVFFLKRDLRMAGYYGCAGDVESVNSTLNGGGAGPYDFSKPIEAVEGGILYPSGTAVSFPTGGDPIDSKDPDCPDKVGGVCTGTAGIALRMADPASAVQLTKTMPNTSAAAFLGAGHGLEAGDIVMLSDCGSADIFQITNLGGGGETIVHNSGAGDPGNSTQNLSRIYQEGEANVMKFTHRLYYIGTGTSGHPSLFRMGIDGTNPEELVEGIENLQLTFGVATEADRTPRVYLPATHVNLGATAENWKNVVSVRATITVHPTLDVTASAQNSNKVEDKDFVATVLMRNLQ